MRDASLWATDLLHTARNHPDQLQRLIEKIQTDAKSAGFGEAMRFATITASDMVACLDNAPALVDCPTR